MPRNGAGTTIGIVPRQTHRNREDVATPIQPISFLSIESHLSIHQQTIGQFGIRQVARNFWSSEYLGQRVRHRGGIVFPQTRRTFIEPNYYVFSFPLFFRDREMVT
jgi:hypothetical protein